MCSAPLCSMIKPFAICFPSNRREEKVKVPKGNRADTDRADDLLIIVPEPKF